MDEALIEQRVICRLCRFIFKVQVPALSPTAPNEDWAIEAQCPSCDRWGCFTPADTPEREPPRPDFDEDVSDEQTHALCERLFEPINKHRSHPAVRWFDRVSIGFFEDDRSEPDWPAPWWVYRFSRGRSAAYVWQDEGRWYVRRWHPLRGRGMPPWVRECDSFEAALDHLLEVRLPSN
jgi:hypothetical protein